MGMNRMNGDEQDERDEQMNGMNGVEREKTGWTPVSERYSVSNWWFCADAGVHGCVQQGS